jgi:hypothetical protein
VPNSRFELDGADIILSYTGQTTVSTPEWLFVHLSEQSKNSGASQFIVATADGGHTAKEERTNA